MVARRDSASAARGRRGTALVVAALAGAGLAAGARFAVGHRGAGGATIPVERAADYIHAVIGADRAVYTKHVVNRLQLEEKVIRASESFQDDKALPLPAQMLRMAAQMVAESGDFRYSLISDAAINKANLPRNEFEKEGLIAVRADPASVYRRVTDVNGKTYALSLYPDRAIANACITCHNMHPRSPRHDWKLGDTMGAVVVALPVN